MSSRTSVYHAFDYITSLAVVGLIFFILNLIITVFANNSGSSTLKDFASYIWAGSLIIFLIFGPFWFFNKLRDWNQPPTGGI